MTAFLLAALATFDDTPSKTVQGFVDALNAHDAAGVARRVVGSKPGGAPLPAEFPTFKTTLGAAEEKGDEATVELDLVVSSPSGPPQSFHETVHLRREGGDWKIEPVDPQGGEGSPRVVGMVAYMTMHPEMFLQAKRAAKSTVCLSNVKQLGLATIMYSADHDDFLPKTAAGWKAAIMPYVKSEKIFHCPEDASGGVSYFLDARVAGKSLNAIAMPASTAMIVEGTAKKTAFRHRGRCAIAFTDGHAKLIDPTLVLKARTVSLK